MLAASSRPAYAQKADHIGTFGLDPYVSEELREAAFPAGRHGLAGSFSSKGLRRHARSLFRLLKKSFANASELFGGVR